MKGLHDLMLVQEDAIAGLRAQLVATRSLAGRTDHTLLAVALIQKPSCFLIIDYRHESARLSKLVSQQATVKK